MNPLVSDAPVFASSADSFPVPVRGDPFPVFLSPHLFEEKDADAAYERRIQDRCDVDGEDPPVDVLLNQNDSAEIESDDQPEDDERLTDGPRGDQTDGGYAHEKQRIKGTSAQPGDEYRDDDQPVC
jgi:hypothetical protein